MLLEQIKRPDDVKKLNMDQLKQLDDEIREKLIATVSQNGGHLASNLGVVELTVGLHYVFDSPDDAIIFDVGHQSYVHKMLTGRYDRFDTIRQEGGLSGFMNPAESEHDPIITGHSSTALSAACGLAEGNRLNHNEHYVIAVVGDGAFTGGMTFEALNNSGHSQDRLIVILNDNKMSISENVGSLAKHLARMRIGERYLAFKRGLNHVMNRIPLIGKPIIHFVSKIKTIVKNALYSSNYFESMGYYYVGPIDGNSIEDVVRTLESVKHMDRPVLVHMCTVKGKGFAFAEQSPTDYHGVSHFDSEVGVSLSGDSFSYEFGQALCALAREDDKLFAITAAMAEGTGLAPFREEYPDRFSDVGIAEQHAVTYACGLSHQGYHPVFAVYSSFLQRGYDQLIHDAALGGATMTVAIDRAGLVGEDGATHQGLFDVSFLNTVPGAKVDSPAFYAEMVDMLSRDVREDGLTFLRYPRGKQPTCPDWYAYHGEPYVLHDTQSDTVAVTYGRLFSNVALACDKVGASVLKLNRIQPIDEKALRDLTKFKRVCIFEESNRAGGVGEVIAARLAEMGYHGALSITAVTGGFVPHMTVESAFARYGFDVDSIVKRLQGGAHE